VVYGFSEGFICFERIQVSVVFYQRHAKTSGRSRELRASVKCQVNKKRGQTLACLWVYFLPEQVERDVSYVSKVDNAIAVEICVRVVARVAHKASETPAHDG
jgi:hypothetical protein